MAVEVLTPLSPRKAFRGWFWWLSGPQIQVDRSAPGPRATTQRQCSQLANETTRNKRVALFLDNKNQLKVAIEVLLVRTRRWSRGWPGWWAGGAGPRSVSGSPNPSHRGEGCNEQWRAKILESHETQRPRQRYDCGQARLSTRGGGFVVVSPSSQVLVVDWLSSCA